MLIARAGLNTGVSHGAAAYPFRDEQSKIARKFCIPKSK